MSRWRAGWCRSPRSAAGGPASMLGGYDGTIEQCRGSRGLLCSPVGGEPMELAHGLVRKSYPELTKFVCCVQVELCGVAQCTTIVEHVATVPMRNCQIVG